MLAEAVAAAHDEDWRLAVAEVLAAWRAHPAPELAIALDALSARVAADVPSRPLVGTTDGHLNLLWRREAAHVDSVNAITLIASLLTTSRSRELLTRIALLEAHGPDPRIAAPVCEALEQGRHKGPEQKPIRDALWAALRRNLHPSALARIRALPTATAWQEPQVQFLRHLVAEHAEELPRLERAFAVVPPVSAEERVACDALVTAAATLTVRRDRRSREEAALLAQVYATPLDDGPRQIYADFLLQHGDPRGEFIALQLARDRLTGRQVTRMLALERAYGHLWWYPLPAKAVNVVFHRGFAARAYDTGEITNDPAWATIRHANRAPLDDNVHLGSLETFALDNLGIARLARLAHPLPSVRTLTWQRARMRDNGWARETADAIEAFAKITCLPALRAFGMAATVQRVHGGEGRDITADDLHWLVRAPQLAAITDLDLELALRHVREVIFQVETMQVRRLGIVATSPGTRIHLQIRRDEANRLRRLRLNVFPRLGAHESRWVLDWLAHERHHFTTIAINPDAPEPIRAALL